MLIRGASESETIVCLLLISTSTIKMYNSNDKPVDNFFRQRILTVTKDMNAIID